MKQIIRAQENCWRIEQADKLSFLIDAADYFATLRKAMLKAKRHIYILSWDIDSRISLLRNGESDGYTQELGDFLNELAAERPELEIYILNWDFAMIYLPDREFLPIYKLGWKTHPRIHFSLDNHHPEGASQHQKVVVIDDGVAFVGGLDLTKGRWDTSEHLPDQPQRDLIDGEIANPYHDIQAVVSGPAAAALGDLARQRWHRATGEPLPVPEIAGDAWPEALTVDINRCSIAIARTQSAFGEIENSNEIQRLYTDAIRSAHHSIYIENQYFTAPSIANAIKDSLQQDVGPQVIMVLPRATDGWLSQHTMDVLRVRRINALIEHDRHHRLKVLFPDAPGLEQKPINVHAKVMVVDDRLAMVGSANLNNRSMSLDSECNIAVDASIDHAARHGIATFRNRLLAEHMGCSSVQVDEIFMGGCSMFEVVDRLNGVAERCLKRLPLSISEEIDRLVPDVEVIDPEHPISPELILPRILPEEDHSPARSRILFWVLSIAAIGGLAAVWRWSPLSEWVDLAAISQGIEAIRAMPAAPLWIILGFVVAGFVAFPFSILIIATAAVFGTLLGFFYSLIGGMLSALIIYGIGEILGRNTVRTLAGSKLNHISRTLARHGVITIIAVRIVPVAPFTVINLVAGASHINFRDYLIGTLIGMTPGMLAVILIADRVYATFKSPDLVNSLLLAATITIVGTAGWLLIRWLKRKSSAAQRHRECE